MTVTFIGHRDLSRDISEKLQNVLVDLIENQNADTFYVGNEGNFDGVVQKTLSALSSRYSQIRVFVVLAYLPQLDSQLPVGLETLYPEGLELVPRRFAISKRNHWMFSRSDTVVTHVLYPASNSFEAKAKAERQGKRVINVL